MSGTIKKYTRFVLHLKPEYLFVVLAVLFGGFFALHVTPLFANDEVVHFPRAYQVQEGRLKAEHLNGYDYGGQVPTQIKQFNDAYREQVQIPNVEVEKLARIKAQYGTERLTDNKKEPLAFTSATLSAGWDYIPPAIGIFVAKTIGLPLNWYVYLGRLTTLAVYVVLTYFAIKYIPIGKRFLLVVALLPTALTQGATIGLDGLVNGLSWLIIALTFAVLVGQVKIKPRLLGLMALMGAYLATTKQGYVPIAALPLLLPARLFPFGLKKVWAWRVMFGVGLLVISLWYLGATAEIAEVIHHIQRPGMNVDDAAQLHSIFQDPLKFLGMIFVQPFTIWAANIYIGIVGVVTNKLLWLPIPIVIMLYVLLLVTSLHKERAHVAGRDRLLVLVSSTGVFIATFALINLALYLSFTRVGWDHVEGLQGRYFLPLLPLLGIILHTAWPRLILKVSDKLLNLLTVPLSILALLVTALIIR